MHNSIPAALAAFVGLSVAQKYVICDNDCILHSSSHLPQRGIRGISELWRSADVDDGRFWELPPVLGIHLQINKLFMLYDSSKLEI
jgi:hypothetical protein